MHRNLLKAHTKQTSYHHQFSLYDHKAETYEGKSKIKKKKYITLEKNKQINYSFIF